MQLSSILSLIFAGLVMTEPTPETSGHKILDPPTGGPSSRTSGLSSIRSLSGLDKRATPKRRSTNWSGTIVNNGQQFSSISAEMTIPNVTFPYGYNSTGTYSCSVWVGFGGFGDLCGDDDWNLYSCAVVQTGFYYLYDPEGDHGVFAFLEWYPDPPIFYKDENGADFPLNIGDRIRMAVSQKNNDTAVISFENLTTGKKNTTDYNAPIANATNNTTQPQKVNSTIAEFVVETFMSSKDQGSRTPNYDTLVWDHMELNDLQNKTVKLAGATDPVNAEPLLDGKFMTNCSFVAENQSTVCHWLPYKNIFPDLTY